MNKVLTLIVPTYNMEKYLDKCLSSLLMNDKDLQKKIEVLVVNDGSTDQSSKIARTFSQKYPDTFIVIDKLNGNYGSCVNRGILEATGKYIKVLDADDFFDSEVFEDYIRFLLTADSDMVVNDFCSVNEQEHIVKTKHYSLAKNRSTFQFDQKIVNKFLRYNLQMHAIAYKTKNLRNIGYKQTEGISYTDQEWTFIPLKTVYTISYYSGVLYYYLIGRVGQTMDSTVFSRSFHQDEICILRKLTDFVNSDSQNKSARMFQKKWIHRNLAKVYMRYLVQNKNLPIENLKKFEEDMIKIYPDGKIISDSFVLPGTKYHFVKQWRQKKHLSGFFFRFNHLYSRVYSRINRILFSKF